MKNAIKNIVIVCGALFGMYEFYNLFVGNDYGTKIDLGPLELYYTDNVSKEKASTLGSYLEGNDFSDGEVMSVQLDKKENAFHFNIVVQEGVANNEEYATIFREVLIDLKTNIFPNDNLTLNLCDDSFERQEEIPYTEELAKPYGDLITVNTLGLYYKDISLEKVRNFGNYLVENIFTDSVQRSVQFLMIDEVPVFKMVVGEAYLSDSSYLSLFPDFRNQLSTEALQGENIHVHLTDDNFNTQKVFK